MEKKRVLILDQVTIGHKLRRMAYEIWERNNEEKEVVLIGIEKGGSILATNLTAILKEISPLQISCLSLKTNKKNPVHDLPLMEENLEGRTVIMVDDVINSGKTMLYSLKAMLTYDIKKLMVAVLVDRKHKSFPIACDIVGHTVATTLQDHIEVETQGNEILAVYLE